MRSFSVLAATAVALLASNDLADASICRYKTFPPGTFPGWPAGFGGSQGWSGWPGWPGTFPSGPPDANTGSASSPAIPAPPAGSATTDASQAAPTEPPASTGSGDSPAQTDVIPGGSSITDASQATESASSTAQTDISQSITASQTGGGSSAETPATPETEAPAPAPAPEPATPETEAPAPATPETDAPAPAPASPSSGASSGASNNSSTSAAGGGGSNSKLCKKPRIRITEVDVGVTVDASEDEVKLQVVAIAALPNGGSRIAFQSGDNVIVRELDKNDKLVSSSEAVKVPLNDFGDLHADADGFVLLGTRDAEGGGTLNCGNPSNLCGTAPNPAVPCYDMYLVRYDGAKESWATKLTSSSASLPPYSTGGGGADVYMIWWYAHHGRLAYDGSNWAAYFGCAISTSEGGCINIHQGDRMKVVDASGKIATNTDSFDWGCSHSGYERITYDGRKKGYATICKTDNNNRIMPPNDWGTTIYPVNLAASNLGDIVPDGDSSSKKYWATVSNGDGDNAAVHLIHFAINAAASEDIKLGGTDANERAPHLASIGEGGMLALWEGSSAGGDLMEGGERTMYAQVLDSTTGKAISEKVTVDKSVVGNRYQALKSFPDGSVAYLSKGTTGTSVQVVRFFGC